MASNAPKIPKPLRIAQVGVGGDWSCLQEILAVLVCGKVAILTEESFTDRWMKHTLSLYTMYSTVVKLIDFVMLQYSHIGGT